MKLLTVKNIHFLLIALLFCVASNIAFSQVYKVVDEDGNVTYTDTAPKNGAKPVDLQPLSVIETPEYQRPATNAADDPVAKGKALRELRSQYRDFAITTPTQEQTLNLQGQNMIIQWATKAVLDQGMKVIISIDGTPQPPTESRTITVPPLDRGEHTITAKLFGADGKAIANASPVTVYIQQPNLYNNPDRIRPVPHNN